MKPQASYHIPVLLDTAIAFLDVLPSGKYIDATAGGGGHAEKILARGGKVLALDVDLAAIEHLKKKFRKEIETGDLKLAKGNFSNLHQIAITNNFLPVSGILFDLGLSSYQLADKTRGFSFESDSLDMRADQDLKITASMIVNNFDKRRLYELFKRFGQERFARSIADAIVSARQIVPIRSAKQLAQIVNQMKPVKVSNINPATKVFQALRIVVNSEIANLGTGLKESVRILKDKGRLVVISYHSLEDGIIKDFFRKSEDLIVVTKKPVRPSLAEIYQNPRSRSAKMRVAEKCQQ